MFWPPTAALFVICCLPPTFEKSACTLAAGREKFVGLAFFVTNRSSIAATNLNSFVISNS
jgi:hypothetical protein